MIKRINNTTLILLLFLTAVLFACQSSPSPDTNPTPTAEPTLTVAQPPTSTSTATAPPLQPTNTAEPTPTPTAIPSPTPAPTATPINWSLIQNGATILYYHDQDLWRSDIDGNQQPITEGDFLAPWDLESDEDKWWSGGIMPLPFISPNGLYIALTQTGGNIIIIDLADPASPRSLSSGSTLMAWSPDSRYLAYGRGTLYLYDTVTQRSQPLTESLPSGVHNITWSPDGRYIGFACCFAEPEGEVYQGFEFGDILQIDIETRLFENVGQTTRSVAGGPDSLCWQDTGQFAPQPDARQSEHCTGSGSRIFYTSRSPDRRQFAKMLYSSPDDPLHFHLLTVEDSETADLLWQIQLEQPSNRLAWSVDGRYLLLNNYYPGLSPIWRLLSDGSATPEPIIEEAFLLDVVPVWQAAP